MARTGERERASRLNPLIDSDHTEDTLENIAAAIDSFASVVADITDLQALQGIALLLPALAAACRFEVEHPRLLRGVGA